MVLNLISILSEDSVPIPIEELGELSAQALSHIDRVTNGGIVEQPDGQTDLLAHSESKAIFLLATPKNFALYSDAAIEIVVIRLHYSRGEELPRGNFPEPNAEWIEASRELVWGEGERPNYSLVRYSKQRGSALISIILSTYNAPEWLEKVLWGYQAQSFRHFEVVIADDGSRQETAEMIARLALQLSYPIKHVWHQDAGFRKCDILNRAILAAATDYLLFSDGDCVPRADFVEVHHNGRKQGRFLSNGYHKIDMPLSNLITKQDILEGRSFDAKWLRANGMKSSFKSNKLTTSGFKRWLLNTFTPTKPTWNGHGASAFLSDILKVNGFDERMKYGGEDREFGERLENIGIRGKQIRYSTVSIHLDHSRGYVSKEEVAKNVALRKITRREKITRTQYGIDKQAIKQK